MISNNRSFSPVNASVSSFDRISHKFSRQAEQDIALDCSKHDRRDCLIGKTRTFLEQDEATGCSHWSRVFEKYGLRHGFRAIGTCLNHKKTIFVDLIKEKLSDQVNQTKYESRKKNLKLAIKYIRHHQNHEKNVPFSIQKINVLARQLYNLYYSLSLDRLPNDESPLLAEKQRKLAISLMAVEKERFQLSSENLQSIPQFVSGVNRYQSQVAFFSYLNSYQGKLIVQELSTKMNEREKIVFNQSIKHLKDLSKNYLQTLSFIEAVKNSIPRSKEDQENISWEKVENQLSKFMYKRVKSEKDFLLPMGWSFPEGKLGHHFLFYVETDKGEKNGRVMRVFDTYFQNSESIDPETTTERNNPAKFSLPQETSSPRLKKPLSFISRKCNQKYHTLKFSDKIQSLARILMLQIPSYTEASLKRCTQTTHNTPINYDLYKRVLSEIVSTPLNDTDTQKLYEDESSPLRSWNWFPAPACALSSFQLLLQNLALKQAELNGIELNEAEATNLKYFFELLQHSHKLFLLNNFFEGREKDVDLLKEVLYLTIAECESKLSLAIE